MITPISISQVMTTDLLILAPDDRMSKVQDLFNAHDIHHLPVVEKDGTIVGIISKSDFLAVCNAFPLFKSEARDRANQQLLNSLLVEEVMTREVVCLKPEDSLTLAGSFFRENLFHAIPIVDSQKKLVGILTPFDLLNYFFNQPALIT